jgi:hypothetical protein
MCSPRVDLAALLWLPAVPALYGRLGALLGPARPAAVAGEVAARASLLANEFARQ